MSIGWRKESWRCDVKKGRSNVYCTGHRNGMSIYRSYLPRFRKHQETEIAVHVSRTAGQNISSNMRNNVMHMSSMIGSALYGEADHEIKEEKGARF